MKILILTLVRITSIEQRDNYSDFFRKIRDEGNEIIIVSPAERKYHESTSIKFEGNATLLKVRTPNIQKSNFIEKSIGTIIIEYLYTRAIRKYFPDQSFDLILYSTPPITLTGLISSLKKKTHAKTYLLLKDIFPQNAVDLKMISNKGFIYRYFRKREEKLYRISDWIGCMSKANKQYILKHNPWLLEEKVEVNPNSIEIKTILPSKDIYDKYSNLFKDKVVFAYGGNLGKPQGIDFLFEVILGCESIENAFFLIVGSGTESKRASKWFEFHAPKNAMMLQILPQNEYNSLLQQCHVGLIFLNRDFTIPNYPSRILPYMLNKMPVICATDKNTDVGSDAEKNEYGFWCQSGDLKKFTDYVKLLSENVELRSRLGNNAFEYLKSEFNVDISYQIIADHFQQ